MVPWIENGVKPMTEEGEEKKDRRRTWRWRGSYRVSVKAVIRMGSGKGKCTSVKTCIKN